MKIQHVSEYIKLSTEGLVPRLECPMDQGPLFPNLNEIDEIYLYCLSCDYKKILGKIFYEKIVANVLRHSK